MKTVVLVLMLVAFVSWLILEIIRFEGKDEQTKKKRKKVSHNVLISILVFYACAQLAVIIASYAG
ncbi:MAG TPA: hypothetical protein PK961_11225 [bacterium]|nr:hypothetical protein [bacterium]